MDDERSPLSSSISSCTGSTRRRAIAMANGVREFARQFLTLSILKVQGYWQKSEGLRKWIPDYLNGLRRTIEDIWNNPPDQQPNKTPQYWQTAVLVFPALAVGMLIGFAATWVLFYGPIDEADPSPSIFHLFIAVLSGFFGALGFVALLVWWAVHSLKRAHGTLEQIVRETTAATRAAIQLNALTTVDHVEKAILEGVVWYERSTARQWIVRITFGLLFGFGGLIGTAMLFRQTILLGTQNEKLDLQTVTAEAQRRAGLSAELFAILQAVSLINAEAAGTTPSQRPTEQVPRGLQARIVALSRAATPYRIIEVPEGAANGKVPVPQLADQARSPERGQLLVGLALAGINIRLLGLGGATFDRADLRNTSLPNASLIGTNLSGADLTGAFLGDADLTRAFLDDANLTGADLLRVNLSGANLSGANLSGADLSGAIVGETLSPGQLPRLFPKGWDGPPAGWELYDNGGVARLRRSGAPAPAPSPP
jgi:hypothetical protein